MNDHMKQLELALKKRRQGHLLTVQGKNIKMDPINYSKTRAPNFLKI
jgi:hypothetical protein